MRKLARMVGVTAPALYRHFDSREEVILALVAEAHRVLGQYLYRSLAARSPEERMRLAGQAYLDFALENPRLYDMLYLAPGVLGLEDYPREVADQACSTGQFWLDRVRECVDSGMLRCGDLESIGVTLWAHAHGLISLFLQGSLPMSAAGFRGFYLTSGFRIAQGLATPEWIARCHEEGMAGAPAVAETVALP